MLLLLLQAVAATDAATTVKLNATARVGNISMHLDCILDCGTLFGVPKRNDDRAGDGGREPEQPPALA
jgi:hypothetical protein